MNNHYRREDFFMERPRHPQSDVATFMETRIALHGDPTSVFSERFNRLETLEDAIHQEKISNELWIKAEDQKNELFNLMEQVQIQLDKKIRNGIQAEKVHLKRCTWQEVMQEVQLTASRWATTPKKTSNFMVCLDRLGRNSAAFESWLQLLPDGDYGSSICGVFSLAIGAIGHYTKVEEAIFDSLVQIPEIIENTRNYIKMYSQTRNHLLEERTFNLYLSILKALTLVMRFFADSTFKKIYQPLVQQSSYQKELLDSLENIKVQALRVKEEANQTMQRRLMDIDQSILTQGDIALDTNQSCSQILGYVQRLLESSVLATSSRKYEDSVGRVMVTEQSQSEVSDTETAPLPLRPVRSIDPMCSKKRARQLLDLISFDPDNISQDIATCIRQGDALDEASKSKAAALIQNGLFKAFLSAEASPSSLVVNGNDDLSCAEGLSPLSLVTARLSIISSHSPRTFVLRYFCDMHKPFSHDDTIPAVLRLMSSILGQLITQLLRKSIDINYEFLDERRWKNLERMKPKALCKSMEDILGQIPENSIVLCILDEISAYEISPLRRDTEYVVKMFSSLAERSSGVIFKLLVTCRGRLLGSAKYFEREILNMEESVEEEDSSTWCLSNMSI